MSEVTNELWSAGSYAIAGSGTWSNGGPELTTDASGARWTLDGRADVAVDLPPRLMAAIGRDEGVAGAIERLSTPLGRRALQVRDGLSGEVLLPDPAAMAVAVSAADPGLVRDSLRAYNEWIAQFAASDDHRFVGVGQIPPTGLEDALDALGHCQRLGLRAVSLLEPPAGPGTAPGGDAEEFWEKAGSDTVVCLASTFAEKATAARPNPHAPAPRTVEAGRPPALSGFLARLAFSGVPDAVPGLRIVVSNAGAGWLPYVLESADTNYQRASASRRVSLGDPDAFPSEYVRRFTWTTFHEDRFSVLHRSYFGESHLMWSAVAPSFDGDWPSDVEQSQRIVAGLGDGAAANLLSQNCRRLFAVPGGGTFTTEDIERFERSSLFN